IDAISRRIGSALARSDFLRIRSWRMVKQGSYHNNTNVRIDSDMDVGVCLNDAIFFEGPSYDTPTLGELNYEPVPFSFNDYKLHIAACLEKEFGRSAVTIGKKAIHLHKENEEKIHADVVPAFTFQLFGPRQGLALSRGTPHTGIALLASDKRLTNFPD